MPSRRKFIQRLGSGVLATGAGLSSVGCQALGTAAEWSSAYDWVCVGSGIAGCAAAIAGHDRGLKTLLLEKMEKLGGTTSQSGGVLWVPMNSMMQDAGIPDSREEALAYMTFVGSGYSRPEYREAYVDQAPRVWDYLRQKADFGFRMNRSEFYYPIAPGSKGRGRLLVPAPFPAETLGPWRNRVQQSVFVHGLAEALTGKEIENAESFGPHRSNDAFLEIWRKRLGSAKVDEILRNDEATRIGGAGLVAYAVRALVQRGVEMRTGADVQQLILDGNRVAGVKVMLNGKEERIRARKGVLLATGGDVDGRGGHGDSWALGAAVGGAVSATSVIVPMITLPAPGDVFPNGKPFGRANNEAGLSHSVIVNRFGERFGDESFFQAFGARIKEFETMGEHRFRNFPCFLVFDQNLLEKHSFVGLPPGNTDGLEWLTQAKSIRELAGKIKMPPAKLEATVSRFNEWTRKGTDSDFNRKPPTMGPIEKPPFYGVEMNAPDPFFAETKIVINPQAQVVDAQGKPIPGLYACGNTTAITRIWGVGYQAGHSLMSAAVYGFLAAEHAAAEGS